MSRRHFRAGPYEARGRLVVRALGLAHYDRPMCVADNAQRAADLFHRATRWSNSVCHDRKAAFAESDKLKAELQALPGFSWCDFSVDGGLSPGGEGAMTERKNCRSCGASILWVKTEAGKAIPLDAEPTEAGNIIIRVGPGLGVETAHVETAEEKAARRRIRKCL